MQKLQAYSKESIGYGYRIVFKPRRFHGNNNIPERMVFNTVEDVFRSAGRQMEAKRAVESYEVLTSTFPVLR
ncbi:MAG: DUF3322 domain-containing protein [Opitutales bacterium]